MLRADEIDVKAASKEKTARLEQCPRRAPPRLPGSQIWVLSTLVKMFFRFQSLWPWRRARESGPLPIPYRVFCAYLIPTIALLHELKVNHPLRERRGPEASVKRNCVIEKQALNFFKSGA